MFNTSNALRLLVAFWAIHIISAQYPKCYEVDTITWPEVDYSIIDEANENGIPGAVVLDKCQIACRTDSNTFCGIKRNGPVGERTRCYCGDTLPNSHDSNACRYRCGGGQYACGYRQSMSVYTVCDGAKYRPTCTESCPLNCFEDVCRVSSGVCHIGCKDGWYGGTCTQSCVNCNNGCTQTDGKCEPGGCKLGFYGEKCDQMCSVNCGGTGCRQIDGECFSCDQGYHGKYCDKSCLNCENGCQQENGICDPGGCNEGYYGLTCEDTCLNCINRCVQESGVCVSDCLDGYYGSKCDLGCPQNCMTASCVKVNGQCKGQCKDGWYSLFCDKTCPANCETSICQYSDGSCTDGCTLGWKGHNCEMDVDECSYDNNVCVSQNKDCYNTEGSYRCCEPYQGFDQATMTCTGLKRSTLRNWVLPLTSVLCVVLGIVVGIVAAFIFQKWRQSKNEVNKTNDTCNQKREIELQLVASAGTCSTDIGDEGQYEECTPCIYGY